VADGGEDDVGGIVGAAFEIAAAEVTFGLQVADTASSPPMHHRIMARSKRESTNEIARFGVLKRQILAISNAPASEKQTPAQSPRGLFTDDCLGQGAMILWWPIRPTPKEWMSRGKIWRLIDSEV